MEEDDYKVPEYPNQEKGFIFDEPKFAHFSKTIFKFPILGYLIGIILNLLYLFLWKKGRSIISIMITIIINYLIIGIILKKVFKINLE